MQGAQREKAQVHLFAGIHKNRNSFHLFASHQKSCKEWRCKTLYMDSDKENWAALADIANNRGKNVAQVSIRSGGKFLQYFLDKCGHLKVAPGETECSLSRHWSEEPGPAGGQPGGGGVEPQPKAGQCKTIRDR